jgi:hypothetical protein
MPTATIRRRVRNLETELALALIPDYPPFMRSEVSDIERRVRAGERLTRIEVHRLEQQSPIINGELIITADRGRVFVKRYLGIDLAQV